MRSPFRSTALRAGMLFLFLTGVANAATVYSTGTADAATGHTGKVTTNGDRLTMRTSPKPNSTGLGTLANGNSVSIVCQMNGTTMTGTFGAGPLWDKLSTGGFVPDVYVNTGSDGRVAPECPAGSSRAMPVTLSMSDHGLNLLKTFEGVVLHPYNDSKGYCTIGVGHLLHKSGCTTADRQKYSIFNSADATALLRADVTRFVSGVRQQLPNTPLAQYEFDALVSFSFNVGLGGLHGSNARIDLSKPIPDYQAVRAHLADYGPDDLECGLKSRRFDEATLFSTGVYAKTRHC